MKNEKLHGFSFYQNIAKFEAFFWNLKLSKNNLFWRCDKFDPLVLYLYINYFPSSSKTKKFRLRTHLKGVFV